jgi:hypothetical protein
MRIVVSHLTRMTKGRICVAGIDLTTGEHIRPVLDRHLSISLAATHGGPFALGAVLDLSSTRNVARRPETEDRLFRLDRLTVKPAMPSASFWRVLTRQAETSLAGVFGQDLHRLRRTWVLNEGHGFASLGCLAPAEIARLWVNQYDRLRMTLVTDEGECTLPVTDLRLFDYDPETDFAPNLERVTLLAEQLGQAGNILLSIGLSRPFMREDDEIARHWLQVNNIHLEQDPLWDPVLCQEPGCTLANG